MHLSISNIAWAAENDKTIYEKMKELGFQGLEIAPTRIFPENPYEKLAAAATWAENIKSEYGFTVSSMQSIWFGRNEKIFGSADERQVLCEYTKKAINFAAATGCNNLVFGCPRNRAIPESMDADTAMNIAVDFFKEIAKYAHKSGTVIGMEANPPIYNTNFINDTLSAIELIKAVDSDGFKLNLDVGTMIQNDEDVKELEGKVHLINHVHISEPGLKLIEARELHKNLSALLRNEDYKGFVSVEMATQEDIQNVYLTLAYTKDIFS